MAKSSGTTRGMKSSSSFSSPKAEAKKKTAPKTQEEWSKDEHVDLDSIKTAISSYSSVGKEKKGSAVFLEFNGQAKDLIRKVAAGDYGLASDIAKRLTSSPYFIDYGAKVSDKQAYVIAKAAFENRLASGYKGNPKYGETVFNYDARETAKKEQAAKDAARAAKQKAYNDSYVRSKTQMKVGSKVYDEKGRECTISSIITKSTGYVKVTYPNGETGKKMAFNLKGEDGNFIKKKPNK